MERIHYRENSVWLDSEFPRVIRDHLANLMLDGYNSHENCEILKYVRQVILG